MLITLHKNATTTPVTGRALQQASGTDRTQAQHAADDPDTRSIAVGNCCFGREQRLDKLRCVWGPVQDG